MNADQYRALRERRASRGPRTLAEVPPVRGRRVRPSTLAAVVADAARRLRQREAAAAAWWRVAAPEWLPDTRVTGLESGPAGRWTAVIAVGSAAVAYEIRRRQLALERQLARLVPGLRRVRFTLGADADGDRR